MTQTEIFSNNMNFNVTDVEKAWANYGVIQYFGTFGNKPKYYQVVSLQTQKGIQNIVKSWSFVPVPTAVAQEITHEVAQELSMKIKEESNDGLRYMANLVSQIKGEVEKGDIVAWGIAVRHSVIGNFRIDASLLRLVCENGLMEPVKNSEIATVEKSYEKSFMKESFLEKARLLQEKFEEELERFRQFKNTK